MSGNVIFIFSTMDTKLIRKTCSIFCLKIPLDMSLTDYPIELKHVKTSQEVGNERLWYR